MLTRSRLMLICGFLCFNLCSPNLLFGQGFDAKTQEKLNSIRWENGPCTAKVGDLAEVKVPAGYKYTGVEGTRVFMELTQNTSTARDLGVLAPSGWPAANDWFLVFEWDDIGYVKDDDKNNLNGDALLQNMRQNQEADNNSRRARGWPTLEIVGWDKAPFYDPQTNFLVWATRLRELDGAQKFETVNYNSRLLGRSGVISANLVVAPERLQNALPTYSGILQGFNYVEGQRYAEWRSGDKIATYGLTGLIAGGAVAVAAKSGVLAKLAKPIIVGVIALFAGIGAIFKRFFGRRQT